MEKDRPPIPSDSGSIKADVGGTGMNIDRAYMTVVIAKLVDDIKAKEFEWCDNGVKVQISFNYTEAMVLLDALVDKREGAK